MEYASRRRKKRHYTKAEVYKDLGGIRPKQQTEIYTKYQRPYPHVGELKDRGDEAGEMQNRKTEYKNSVIEAVIERHEWAYKRWTRFFERSHTVQRWINKNYRNRKDPAKLADVIVRAKCVYCPIGGEGKKILAEKRVWHGHFRRVRDGFEQMSRGDMHQNERRMFEKRQEHECKHCGNKFFGHSSDDMVDTLTAFCPECGKVNNYKYWNDEFMEEYREKTREQILSQDD